MAAGHRGAIGEEACDTTHACPLLPVALHTIHFFWLSTCPLYSGLPYSNPLVVFLFENSVG
jgi:hypothetical protein